VGGSTMIRLLVCGGRNYTDRDAVFRVLDRVHAEKGISVLIHGAATGADALAGKWAVERGVDLTVFPATWRKADGSRDNGAGSIRNARMLAEGQPDAVVAFPGGGGTANMIDQARKAGVPVWQPMEGKDG